MLGYAARCRLTGLGRLSLPTRPRFRDGWIRITRLPDGRVECLLVDRDDHVKTMEHELDAIDASYRMGLAAQLAMTRYNDYQGGEQTGVTAREQVAV